MNEKFEIMLITLEVINNLACSVLDEIAELNAMIEDLKQKSYQER